MVGEEKGRIAVDGLDAIGRSFFVIVVTSIYGMRVVEKKNKLVRLLLWLCLPSIPPSSG